MNHNNMQQHHKQQQKTTETITKHENNRGIENCVLEKCSKIKRYAILHQSLEKVTSSLNSLRAKKNLFKLSIHTLSSDLFCLFLTLQKHSKSII